MLRKIYYKSHNISFILLSCVDMLICAFAPCYKIVTYNRCINVHPRIAYKNYFAILFHPQIACVKPGC